MIENIDPNTLTDFILNLKPPALLLVGLFVLGTILKAIPGFANWLIPVTVCFVGAILFPFIGEYSPVIKAGKFPGLALAVMGFCIGGVAVGVHQIGKQLWNREAPSAEKTGTLAGTLMMILGLAIPLLCGCQSQRLEAGGAYAPVVVSTDASGTTVTNVVTLPDYQFYVVDSAFSTTYEMIDLAFKFEKDNRALLWKISPEIKHALDKLRPQASLLVRSYALARKAYKDNPTPAGLDMLTTYLNKAQQLTAAVNAALPAAATSIRQ